MEFESRYEILRTVEFILNGTFLRVALQFPDNLLKDSFRVVSELRKQIKLSLDTHAKDGEDVRQDVQLFVMADTTYGSCCVDEVGALHVNADCVVHYGHTCLSPTSKLPALFVFGKAPLDPNQCAEVIFTRLDACEKPILVLYGLEYAYAIGSIKEALEAKYSSINGPSSLLLFAEVMYSKFDPRQDVEDSCTKTGINNSSSRLCIGGLTWSIPDSCKMEDCVIVWIGDNSTAFSNVVLTFSTCQIVRYSVEDGHMVNDDSFHKGILKRRYYLVEKAKDARMVGILVGTLGVAGYLHMIRQMKQLVKEAGKKSYTFVMGRLNPAKLANFPECDVFVHVACPQTALVDSKEFLAPVITPFEAMLAFTKGSQWTGEYVMDFQNLLKYQMRRSESNGEEARFSFLKGGYVEDSLDIVDEDKPLVEASLALAEMANKALQIGDGYPNAMVAKGSAKSGTEFFSSRTFKGLDIDAESPAQKSVIVGRTGRAARYDDEK